MVNYNGWYDNKSTSTPYNKLGYEWRWRLFIEKILSVRIGIKVKSVTDVNKLISERVERERASNSETNEPLDNFDDYEGEETGDQQGLYYILLYSNSDYVQNYAKD